CRISTPSTPASSLATQEGKPQILIVHRANIIRPADCETVPQAGNNSNYQLSSTQSGPVHQQPACGCVSLDGWHLRVPPQAVRRTDRAQPVSACWRTKNAAPSLGQLF